MINALGSLPNPLHEAVVRIASGFNFANLIVSDIPGPDHSLHLFGRKGGGVLPIAATRARGRTCGCGAEHR